MRQFGWIGAGFAALALTGCGPQAANDQAQKPETGDPVARPDISAPDTKAGSAAIDATIAPYMALLETPFSQTGGDEADLTALVAALPAYVTLDWDTKSFDASTGATVFTGLEISFGEETPFGARLDEASLWGLEANLLTARLGGQRLDEAGPLFARFDGRGMTYFGLAAATNALITDWFDTFELEMPEGMELSFDTYEFTAKRMVVTDAALRPWELLNAPASLVADLDEDARENALTAIHFGQKMIAITRSMQYGNTVMTDMVGTFAMRQMGATTEAEISWDLYAASGSVGMDLDQMVIKDGYTKQVSEYTEIAGELGSSPMAAFPPGFRLAQEETYALSTVEGLRLDKAMGYLARSELPGMEVRDLLSLGRWTVRDYTGKLNDKTILTAESVRFNADKFAWLIPTEIGYEFNQATINIDEASLFFKLLAEGLMSGLGEDIEDESEKAEFELVMQGIDKAIDLLPEHGLETISFDTAMTAKWGADTGPADLAISLKAEGFGDMAFDVAVDLPVYAQLQTAFESVDKEAAFEDVFEAAFAFKGLHWLERDKGGYDKIFGFAQAIGKEYPDEGWGVMLANMEPAQMRTYLATIIRIGKTSAEQEFPPAADWLEAYASYMVDGGTIALNVDPPVPLTKDLIEGFDDDPEPDEIVETFGISVIHTK